ncbi:pilus assembly protein PilY [Variovorax paradoxus]|nr:PilC/PilY family type IV pilus protein [Variovorax paradoxus]MBT2300811.1 pilus assembly protein PilY [Variovorax paradoxus]
MKTNTALSRQTQPLLGTQRILVLTACAVLIAAFAPSGRAAVTDLSSQPLATLPTVQAKPNLLFILDDSGSMDSDYMPDDMSSGISRFQSIEYYGFRSAQCNGVAYDPSQTYSLPLNADGTPYPNATFSNAKADGYSSSSSATDLTNSYYYRYNGSQPKMGWVYDTNGAVANTFYNECRTRANTSTSLFTMVTMTAASADAQNYANWYSYYRKRYLLMRTAMGRAIFALDSSYRVGFSTISDTGVTDGTNYFRDVKDFDSTQKANFYSSLYAAPPSGYTPLRGALSKAGRYFAKKTSGQTYDPVQYSCQRNYTLLSTDGYWNTHDESSTYGPFRLTSNTEVGEQDGSEVRPMKDGSTSIATTVTHYTAPATRSQTSTQTHSFNWTRTATTVSTNRGQAPNRCPSGQYRVTTQTQVYTQQSQTQAFVTPQSATASYDQTVVATDGVITSGPTNSSVTYSAWTNTAAATTTTTDGTNYGAPTAGSTYTDSGNAVLSCQGTPGTGVTTYTTPAAGSWSAWSALSTSNSTPVIGTYTAGTPTTTAGTSGGDSNTLADVAQYYYATDLRTSALGNCTSTSSGSSQDVCSNIVPPIGSDAATWQHMNTYTIGLGVSGTLTYDRNYLTQTVGSYANLKNGTANWPDPTNDEGASRIDDLWHAGVNGRGQYYSALSASALSEAINGVVTSVQQVAGSASAASTSSLELVAGDNNQVYKASYTTSLWTGDLQAYSLRGSDATLGTTPIWSAQARLDAVTFSTRKIYFGNGSTRQNFEYTNLSTAQKAYFDNLCSQSVVASQCATLSTSTDASVGRTVSDKTLANTGTNLVNYLRGARTHESASTDTSGNTVAALYRKRDHVLGDIVNGAPVHVSKPPFSYADAGYADFIIAQASRKPVVYVAANDGMLHAFSSATADGGTELWAYVPGAVMPNLYKLADSSYASKHQYFVDGAPVMGDIKVGSTWKTILVGGLNGGGRSYYALDITDPEDPKPLWEFTDANLGLSYGNPVITKIADGTWVVAFASGYNNTGGDGLGHLYVLDANSGTVLRDITTSAGSTATPSGLAKINAWIDSPNDNTTKRFYGGDLLGNLWRFDIDDLLEPNRGALLLAKFQINASTPQPITIKPETVEVSGKPVVIVATGRYLGITDIESTTQQSIYGVRDTLTGTGWGDVRADTTNFVTQTFTLTRDANGKAISAAVTDNTVDWATKGGWRLDLPQAGERVSSNMGLQYSTLSIGTTIPSGNACDSGGAAWRYYLDVTNGGVVNTNPAGELWSSNALIVGMSWIKDSNGNVRIIYQNSDGSIRSEIPPIVSSSGAGGAHRTSWRELRD